MEIKQFIWDKVDANSWLIKSGKSGLLIDAVDSVDLYKTVEQVDDLTIIITHAHFDHICGLNTIRTIKPNARVISTSLCSEYLGNKYRNMSATAQAFLKFYKNGAYQEKAMTAFTCEPSSDTFSEKYSFLWSGHKVTLSSVTGHSKDGLIATIDNRFLFSGDTLLPIPTITRFPSGSTETFWKEDIPFLNSMKSIEKVYPGHGSPGDLKEMIKQNRCPEKLQKIYDCY